MFVYTLITKLYFFLTCYIVFMFLLLDYVTFPKFRSLKMCKRLRDCAIPECVRTVIPSQYLLRSNISGMSTSLGTVNAKDTRDTIHTLRRCVEGQQRAVHLKKMQTSKCVQ